MVPDWFGKLVEAYKWVLVLKEITKSFLPLPNIGQAWRDEKFPNLRPVGEPWPWGRGNTTLVEYTKRMQAGDSAYSTCTDIEVLITIAMMPAAFVCAWATLGGVFKALNFMSLPRLIAIVLPTACAVTAHNLMSYYVCSPAAHQAIMWWVAVLDISIAYAGASWMLARASDAKKAAIEETVSRKVSSAIQEFVCEAQARADDVHAALLGEVSEMRRRIERIENTGMSEKPSRSKAKLTAKA